MESLKYLYHLDSGRNFLLEEGAELTIGRAFDNRVVIDAPFVSRHHAAIGWKNRHLYIRDLHSTNGIVINGIPVFDAYAYEVNDSDEIRIGNERFVVLDQSAVIAHNFSNQKIPGDTAIMYTGF